MIVINEKNQSKWIEYPFHGSLVAQSLKVMPSVDIQKSLIQSELSFLYSTQYFAEDNGEVALEHMRQRTYQPTKQNKILDMQIRDELAHVDLLKRIVDNVDLDKDSTSFAKGYTQILYSATSLSEKVFIFQIMTEAVSSAYLNWRLQKIANDTCNMIDQEIFNDEVRHLKMGRSLLEMCDHDELKHVLTPERRRELVRDMSHMCSQHFLNGVKRIINDHGLTSDFQHKTTDLDKMVARTILSETKSVASVIEGVS